MIRFLSSQQMREADSYTINVLGVPSQTLMERAGQAIADVVEEEFNDNGCENITIVCGSGNNGGDGYVCARLLLSKGYPVSVYSMGSNFSPDCKAEKDKYIGSYTDKINGLVVDCIFGTGLSREVSGEYKKVIESINENADFIISADIPSGLNGDNGLVLGVAVKADITVAIDEYKLGYVLNDGEEYCGSIMKRDIGITVPEDVGAFAYTDEEVATLFPKRKRNTHKGSYGSANLVVGSKKYKGAAALCLEAALRSGCGYVKITTAEEVSSLLFTAFPQAIYLDEVDLTSTAIAIGSGCGKSRGLYDKICYLLKNYTGKLIIDADGLNVLAEYGVEVLKDKTCQVLITPHVGEFARLTALSSKEILSDMVKYAQTFATEHNITVLLKSAVSVITDGEKTYINLRGTTALAKGGSGDMLTGLIVGTTARGVGLTSSALLANYVLGASAELASQEKTDYCTTAKDILKCLPKTVKSLTSLN